MRAVIYTQYGPPEVLQIQEVEKPVPKDHEILVKIVATTVNSGDVRVRSLDVKGWLKIFMRLALGISKPRKSILGTTFSGDVESIGNKVTKFRIGDKVFGMTGFQFGTHAEYVVVNEKSHVLPIPENASFEEAAAIVFGGQTAIYFLHKAKIEQRQKPKVMILGATGSVGAAAIQIAKYFKADITAICSSRGEELIKELGVDRILLYDKEDIFECKENFDIIFDAVGKYNKNLCMGFLNKGGVFVSVKNGYAAERLQQLQLLKQLFEQGHLRAVIDKTYSINAVVEAHRYVDTGRKKGNVVLRC
ncbi:MAG: NAD(P)-dependent alcohol dehydrogenase [Chitinophagaceae bacterium]